MVRTISAGRRRLRRDLAVGWVAVAVAAFALRAAAADGPTITPPRLLEAAPLARPAPSEDDPAIPPGELSVELELTIDADGTVGDAAVVRPVGGGFDEAAVEAVRCFRFEPARRDGVAVAARVRFELKFPPLPEPETEPEPQGAAIEPAAVAATQAPAPAAVESTADTKEDLSFSATAAVREAPHGTTRRTVAGEALNGTPGTRGDPLRVIELLPGVARPPVGAGLIIVRGSAPNDSEISFEGTQVLRLYHFGGLTSFVNGRLVDHIDLYPGNFSVRYGRRIGGIVDVGARDPRGDGLHLLADVNIVDATAMVEGPIGPHAAIAASVRQSHIGAILSAFAPAGTILAAPIYDDYQLIVSYRPTPRDRLRLLGYGSRDELGLILKAPDQDASLRGAASSRTYFHRAGLVWEHAYSDRVQQRAQVTAGAIGFIASIGDALSQNITGPELFGRGELEVRAGDRLTLLVGVDVAAQWLHADYSGPTLGASEGDPGAMGPVALMRRTTLHVTGRFARPAGYLEATLRPTSALTLIGGARVDYFSDVDRTTIDPRLTGRLAVTSTTTLKAGAGLFSQPPDYGQAVAGLGNPNLTTERALHLDVGVDRALTPTVSLGVEAFGKRAWSLIVATPGATGALANDGIGRIYGLEVSLKAAAGDRAAGFLSYTLERSERRDHAGNPWRLFDFDQTHILTAAASARLGRGWRLGAVFRLTSGNPETPIVGSVYDADHDLYRPVYGATNSARAPLYHRLDLRVEKQWRPGRVLLAGYLDLQNAYNEKNTEFTGYGYDYRQRVAVYGLPILPSLGVRGEL